MKIIESVEEMREYSQQCKRDGKTIASIATEGELHDGHMSLVKIAKENVDVAVLTIFHTIDYFQDFTEEYEAKLKRYKQDFIEKEIEICKLNNVDVLFLPSMDDLYLDVPPLNISIPVIDQLVKDRPDHPPVNMKFISPFLFSIIMPDVSVLGQKDVYMAYGIKYFVKHLNLPIKVIIAPTVRDSNGVALSSSNWFLTQDDYNNLISVYKTLQEVSTWPAYPSIQRIKMYINECITRNNGIVNHIDICCAKTLEELDSIDRKSIIIVNVKFGDKDHITDNIFIYQ